MSNAETISSAITINSLRVILGYLTAAIDIKLLQRTLVLLLITVCCYFLTPLPQKPIEYTESSTWFSLQTYYSQIESNAIEKRFTIRGEITSLNFKQDRWLATTSAGQLLESANGRDWREIFYDPLANIFQLAIDDSGDRLLMLGIRNYFSDDGGVSWQSLSPPALPNINTENDWALNNASYHQGLWLAAGANGLFSSRDGVNWQLAADVRQDTDQQQIPVQSNVQSQLQSQRVAQKQAPYQSNLAEAKELQTQSNNESESYQQPWEFLDVVRGAGQWLAITEGQIYASTNAEQWHPVYTPTTNFLTDLHFSNGSWLLISDDEVYASTDGTDWQSVFQSRSNEMLYHIAYGNNTWLVLGENKILMSRDTSNWQTVKPPVSNILLSAAFANSRWLAAGTEGMIESSDGVTWLPINVNHRPRFNSLGVSESEIVAASDFNFYRFTANQSWQREPPDFYFNGNLQNTPAVSITSPIEAIDYANDVWVLAGENGIMFNMGYGWQAEEFIGYDGFHNVKYLGQRWFAMGDDLFYSENGKDWMLTNDSAVKPPYNPDNIELMDKVLDIAFDGFQYIAIRSFDKFISTDGISWERLQAPQLLQTSENSSSAQSAIAYGNGLWVTVGVNDIYTSSDGTSWQVVRENPQTAKLNDVIFYNGRWVAVGDRDILTSVDGTEWLSLSQEDASYARYLQKLFFQGDKLLTYNNTRILTSENGLEWKEFDDYETFPSPLTLIFTLLSLASICHIVIKLIVSPSESNVNVTDEFINDNPIKRLEDDKLGRVQIAKTLAKFIRSRSRSKPFTLAISGAWGSGKSSLMAMTESQLKLEGVSPVWFNPWHNQEVNLLGSLMEAMKAQAMPQIWTLKGFSFYLTLACYRTIKKLHLFVLALIIIIIIGELLERNKQAITKSVISSRIEQPFYFNPEYFKSPSEKQPYFQKRPIDSETQISQGMCYWDEYEGLMYPKRSMLFSKTIGISSSHSLPVLKPNCHDDMMEELAKEVSVTKELGLRWFAGVAALLGFISQLSAFGFSSILSKNTNNDVKRNEVAILAVKEKLKEVGYILDLCRANSLVFFIDDLDRMHKDKLHSLIEIINMLSSDNREAFFVLGMDYNKVVEHLDAQLQVKLGEHNDAEHYLQKIINVVFTPNANVDLSKLFKDDEISNTQESKLPQIQSAMLSLINKVTIPVVAIWLTTTLFPVQLQKLKNHFIAQPIAIESPQAISDNRAQPNNTNQPRETAETTVPGSQPNQRPPVRSSAPNETVNDDTPSNARNDSSSSQATSTQDESQLTDNRQNIQNNSSDNQEPANTLDSDNTNKGQQDKFWLWLLVPIPIVTAITLGRIESFRTNSSDNRFKRFQQIWGNAIVGINRTPRNAKRQVNLLRMISLYMESQGLSRKQVEKMTSSLAVSLSLNAMAMPNKQALIAFLNNEIAQIPRTLFKQSEINAWSENALNKYLNPPTKSPLEQQLSHEKKFALLAFFKAYVVQFQQNPFTFSESEEEQAQLNLLMDSFS